MVYLESLIHPATSTHPKLKGLKPILELGLD